ncbi:hypothetical protein ABC733_24765 [Mangrovibacter sp. SLW1]
MPTIATPALNLLLNYQWPGNVRELENVMERAVLLADEGMIHSYHLPINLQPMNTIVIQNEGLEARLARVEYDLIVEALTKYQGMYPALQTSSE